MVRWLLAGVALFAAVLGAAGAFAAPGGSRDENGATVAQDAGAPEDPGSEAPGRLKRQDEAGQDEAEGGDDGVSAQGQEDCTEAETVTHGCAVSSAVHEAQASSTPGAGRGIAVSTAARTADCSMLPEGAQAACAKRAEKPHPNADGTPGNRPSGQTAGGASATPTPAAGTQANQSGNGKGKGAGKNK